MTPSLCLNDDVIDGFLPWKNGLKFDNEETEVAWWVKVNSPKQYSLLLLFSYISTFLPEIKGDDISL